MIEKERLEELIEQGATVYMANRYTEGIFLDKRNFEVTDKELVFKYKIYAVLLEDLFETKEDAEEYAEFGNITRTERLELPSWEDVKSLTKYTKHSFYGKDNALYGLCIKPKDSLTRFDGSIEELESWCGIDVDGNCEIEHFAPLTRENYNEARRLCVKLFKGEEV